MTQIYAFLSESQKVIWIFCSDSRKGWLCVRGGISKAFADMIDEDARFQNLYSVTESEKVFFQFIVKHDFYLEDD